MTHPGSEPPAMDATTAETPTEQFERKMAAALAGLRESFDAPCGDPKCESIFCFLASHLPALMAATSQSATTSSPVSSSAPGERPDADFLAHCIDYEQAIITLAADVGLVEWDLPSDVVDALRSALQEARDERDEARKFAEQGIDAVVSISRAHGIQLPPAPIPWRT